MESKICKTCGEEKSKDEFVSRINKKNGRRYWDGECRICGSKRATQWYWDNRDHKLAKDRERYATDEAHREEEKRKGREWYWANKEHCNRRANEWRKAHPERDAAASRLYRVRHPEKTRLLAKKGRAKRQKAKIGSIRKSDIEALHRRQKGKCAVCSVKLTKRHIDHIMPLALGGSHEVKNLQLLCPRCNLSKTSKHPVDFMQSRGFLL